MPATRSSCRFSIGGNRLEEIHAKVRPTNALGISGNRQERKDGCDADDLKKRLRKRERKNGRQLRSAVWPREKENATNQVGNVMDKPGQGGSELHVQE